MMPVTLAHAYDHCLRLTRGHYENFPVASRLLPRALRTPVAVVYAFARTADDFADEGDDGDEIRLAKLDEYWNRLDALRADGAADDLIFIALADVIRKFALPLEPFYDLLTAFRMDVTKKRYADYAGLLHYCRHSANPVGRLVLHLSGMATAENLRDSDAICTALQLINFWQDLEQDYHEKGRIYLPQDEMAAHGVTEDDLRARRTRPALRALMDMQIARSRELLLAGTPLGRRLPGRLGFEIRLTVQGGLRILDALAANRADAFARPRIKRREWPGLLWKSL